MWELDHKEGWVPKNWCFWTVVLQKTLESLLDIKEIKAVNPCGNQPWILIGRIEALILWPPDAKSWVIGRDPDPGKDWLRAEGEGDDREWYVWMASSTQWTWVWVNSGSWWWTGRPGCCNSWGRKESDTTERLIWYIYTYIYIYHKLSIMVPWWWSNG